MVYLKFLNLKIEKLIKKIKIIYVSKIDIYKNQIKIINAIKKLKNKFNIQLSLVGSYDYKNKKILDDKIKILNMSDNVKILGKISLRYPNYTNKMI